MDLADYPFPELSNVEIVFSTLQIPSDLLDEAKRRNPKKGIEKFKKVFYFSDKIVVQSDIQGTWKEKAYWYAIALIKSFEPKHEDKELVVGMLFEEVLILTDL